MLSTAKVLCVFMMLICVNAKNSNINWEGIKDDAALVALLDFCSNIYRSMRKEMRPSPADAVLFSAREETFKKMKKEENKYSEYFLQKIEDLIRQMRNEATTFLLEANPKDDESLEQREKFNYMKLMLLHTISKLDFRAKPDEEDLAYLEHKRRQSLEEQQQRLEQQHTEL